MVGVLGFRSFLSLILLFGAFSAFVIAFSLSLPFLFAYSDYFHITLASDIPQEVPFYLGWVLIWGILPLVSFLGVCLIVFVIERKMELETNFSLLFLILSVLSVLWGALHLWNAIGTYYAGVAYARSQGLDNVDNVFLAIYGGYGLGVGVLWVAAGVVLLLLKRSLSKSSL